MSQNSRINVAVAISPVEAADGAFVCPQGAILSNLPPGAVPSAGFPCSGGEWLLTGGDLDGLTVSVPGAHAGEFRPKVLGVHDHSISDAAFQEEMPIEVLSGEVPTAAARVPGRVVPLDLSAACAGLDRCDQVYDVTVTGIPSGGRLSAGIDNGDDVWTLLPDHFANVDLVLPDGFSGAVTLVYCVIGVGPRGELRRRNAHADFWIDVEAAAGISFGPGLGRVHFIGRGSERDVIRLHCVEHGPSDEIAGLHDWKLILDDPATAAKVNGKGLRFDPEASGSIVLANGNELSFAHVTSIQW